MAQTLALSFSFTRHQVCLWPVSPKASPSISVQEGLFPLNLSPVSSSWRNGFPHFFNPPLPWPSSWALCSWSPIEPFFWFRCHPLSTYVHTVIVDFLQLWSVCSSFSILLWCQHSYVNLFGSLLNLRTHISAAWISRKMVFLYSDVPLFNTSKVNIYWFLLYLYYYCIYTHLWRLAVGLWDMMSMRQNLTYSWKFDQCAKKSIWFFCDFQMLLQTPVHF